MGCHGSTAIAEPQAATALGRLPTEGTPATGLPLAEKVAAGEGSDTSTDDISSSSLQVSGEASDQTDFREAPDNVEKEVQNSCEWSSTHPESAPEPQNYVHDCDAPVLEITGNDDVACHGCKDEMPVAKDTALRILHQHLGREFSITPSESEASTPRLPAPEVRDAQKLSDAKQVSPSPRVSCLIGTSQREPGRRVSFNDAGPEVVHVEPLEQSLSTLRRASAISADDMDDVDPLEPMEGLEPLEPLSWSDPELETPPWADHLDSLTVYEPQLSPQVPPQCLSRFGLCCVPRIDGNLVLHGDLEYDLRQEGQDTALPYASQLSQTQAPRSHAACL